MCVSFQFNHSTRGFVTSLQLTGITEANESSEEKKPPPDVTGVYLLNRIPATDCIPEHYLLRHLQFLLCRLELVTVLHRFKVGRG